MVTSIGNEARIVDGARYVTGFSPLLREVRGVLPLPINERRSHITTIKIFKEIVL